MLGPRLPSSNIALLPLHDTLPPPPPGPPAADLQQFLRHLHDEALNILNRPAALFSWSAHLRHLGKMPVMQLHACRML